MQSIAESPHPVQQGIYETVLHIPGVSEMTLEICPQTKDTISNGGTISIFRNPDEQDLIANSQTLIRENTFKVSGNKVYIHLNTGFSTQIWGFRIVATAKVREECLSLPWLTDLLKSVGFTAGSCATCLVRGTRLIPQELEAETVLQNQILQEGFRHTTFNDNLVHILEELPVQIGDFDMRNVKKFLSSPEDHELYQVAYDEWKPNQYHTLSKKLEHLLENVPIEVCHVPLASEVDVKETVRSLFAVLIRHNMITGLAEGFSKSHDEAPVQEAIPEQLAHLWKASNRLRLILRQKSQQEAAKLAMSKVKDENLQMLQTGQEEKDDLFETEESEAKQESDRAMLYSRLAQAINKKCEFLLKLHIVPSSDTMPPLRLLRRNSSESEHTNTEASREVDNDRTRRVMNTLQAWQANREQVSLRQVSGDDRFPIVWKLVMSFLDSPSTVEDLDCVLIKRQERAINRIIGTITLHIYFCFISILI